MYYFKTNITMTNTDKPLKVQWHKYGRDTGDGFLPPFGLLSHVFSVFFFFLNFTNISIRFQLVHDLQMVLRRVEEFGCNGMFFFTTWTLKCLHTVSVDNKIQFLMSYGNLKKYFKD